MVKAGYKQTEVGIIPEDWDVKTMQAMTLLMTNGFVGTAKTHYTESQDGVVYIQGYNVEENAFNFNGVKRVTQGFHKKNSKSCLEEGDVLTVQTGDVGLTSIVTHELSGSNCHALIISRFKRNLYNPYYFSYYLNSQQGRSRLTELETGTTMKHINVGSLLHFEIAFPPTKKEQTAIATVLSDVDALIASLNAQIAKKRDIKTATMQQLLTGKQRLAGFGEGKGMKPSELGEIPEDWEVVQIKQFAPLQRGFDLPSYKRKDGDFPVVYSNGILNSHVNYMVEGDGVVTGRSGTIGKVHYVKGNFWPHNTTLWVTSYKKAFPLFVFYLYGFIGFERFLSGSGVPTLNRNDVHDFLISIPEEEEQGAIAGVLSAMDEEIAALEQRLAKTKAMKQGMMQELLTGRTRLV